MVKLQELLMLARIMNERLRDQEPDQELMTHCLQPVWPYIYPYGTISYIKKHTGNNTGEIDRRKTQKMLRALNGSRRTWQSFIIGLCYTYREQHSLQRNRARLAQKTIHLGKAASGRDLEELAEQFRRQAQQYALAVNETQHGLVDPAEAAEQVRLAKTVCNEENIPRFLLLCRSMDCEKLLQMASPDILSKIRFRYENPTPLTLAFDLLQEHIALDDSLWQQFKKLLASASRYS